jgi:hypothetical protein
VSVSTAEAASFNGDKVVWVNTPSVMLFERALSSRKVRVERHGGGLRSSIVTCNMAA